MIIDVYPDKPFTEQQVYDWVKTVVEYIRNIKSNN